MRAAVSTPPSKRLRKTIGGGSSGLISTCTNRGEKTSRSRCTKVQSALSTSTFKRKGSAVGSSAATTSTTVSGVTKLRTSRCRDQGLASARRGCREAATASSASKALGSLSMRTPVNSPEPPKRRQLAGSKWAPPSHSPSCAPMLTTHVLSAEPFPPAKAWPLARRTASNASSNPRTLPRAKCPVMSRQDAGLAQTPPRGKRRSSTAQMPPGERSAG
mmetsp:Transcript_32730/g.102491  ORF Transcript_32730/g.102491 Transcript_32730/m.102491 type:complete len:217 (-) Transcript_32730:153-803(-)